MDNEKKVFLVTLWEGGGGEGQKGGKKVWDPGNLQGLVRVREDSLGAGEGGNGKGGVESWWGEEFC